ncbi:MAG: MgtC/SapB family protein [Acetobacteraceae bacterium]
MPTDPIALLARLAAVPIIHTNLALAMAFVLGTLIGFERQWRQRTAGLRTNVLVAVGAAAFADLGMRLLGNDGATRIIAYIVSGIGFLGAGVILKDGATIRGLNTAATLWCSAAVGAFSGAGLFGEAVSVTAFVLAGNTLLRPLVNWVNRRPIHEQTMEARYHVHVTCARDDIADARDLLSDTVEAGGYPVLTIETESETEQQVELIAVLSRTEADPAELDALTDRLEQSPIVESATWSLSATG